VDWKADGVVTRNQKQKKYNEETKNKQTPNIVRG